MDRSYLKFTFLLILILLNNILITSQNSEFQHSKYTPYFPEKLKSQTFLNNDPVMTIRYNLWMHNYDDALSNFEKLNLSDLENISYFHMYVVNALEILYLNDRFDDIFVVLDNWNIVEKKRNIKSDYDRYQIVRMYYDLKIKSNDVNLYYDSILKYYIKYSKIEQEFITKENAELLNYLAIILSEFTNNDSLAFKLLDASDKGYFNKNTILIKSMIISKKNKIEAISLLENMLTDFFEIQYENPMTFYSNNIERIRMFLAYLYYSVEDSTNAYYNFELAVTSTKQGSTFMDNWDYWLNLRDYFEDEHDVLLVLKEMYIKRISED